MARFRTTIAVALCTTVLGVAAPSRAQSGAPDLASAALHFDRGVVLYDQGNHSLALAEFRAAYAAAPDFRVLYNIGQAAYELHDYAAAIESFTRYLAEGAGRVPAPRRQAVTADIARLQRLVSRLRIRVDVEGATVRIDGAPVGTTPLAAPVAVNVGRHVVEAEIAGRSPVVQQIDSVADRDATVTLAFAGAQPPSAGGAPGASTSSRGVLGIVLLGAGGALLAGALVTDLVAVKGALDDFDEKRARNDPAAADAKSSARTLQTATIIGYAAGVVVAGAGAAVLLWPSKPPARAHGWVRLGLRPDGVVAVGRF